MAHNPGILSVMKRMNFDARLVTMRSQYGSKACWPWPGHINKRTGYANAYAGRDAAGRDHQEMAHRLAYRRTRGDIPDGLVIDHKCRNRACINPDHLRAVTQIVNLQSGLTNASKEYCKNGHALSGDNVRYGKNRLGGPERRCIACNREWQRKRRHKHLKAERARDRKRYESQPHRRHSSAWYKRHGKTSPIM